MTPPDPATRRGARRPATPGRGHFRGCLAVICLAMALAAAPAGALDITEGKLRLSLYGGTGRFSLAWQTGRATFVPLLAADDPRTSMLRILVGNRVYTMGDSPEFAETLEKTDSGARFLWKSAFLEVTETFSFVPASGTSTVSGVRIELTLKNVSSQDASVGVRYLFDTWLGEASFVYFRTDTLSQMAHETVLVPADGAAWWASPRPGDPDGLGLQVMLTGSGVTPPDRVVFANWKRLTDSPWAYDVSTVRTFSVLPYSVNDSAASQYYNSRTVARGGEASLVLVLGKFSDTGLSTTPPPTAAATAATSSGAAGQETPPAPGSGAGAATRTRDPAVLADIASLDAILEEINAALASGKPLSADRLARIQDLLKQLSARAAGASPGSGDAGK